MWSTHELLCLCSQLNCSITDESLISFFRKSTHRKFQMKVISKYSLFANLIFIIEYYLYWNEAKRKYLYGFYFILKIQCKRYLQSLYYGRKRNISNIFTIVKKVDEYTMLIRNSNIMFLMDNVLKLQRKYFVSQFLFKQLPTLWGGGANIARILRAVLIKCSRITSANYLFTVQR